MDHDIRLTHARQLLDAVRELKQVDDTERIVLMELASALSSALSPSEQKTKQTDVDPHRCDRDFRDISDLVATEKKFLRTERRFRDIFHNITEGLLIADAESKTFVMANESMCQMLGYSEAELIGLSVSDIHPPDKLPHVIEAFEKQLSGEFRLASELPCQRKDGSVFYADISSVAIELDDHPTLLGCFRDVTERRQLEAQLAQADRLANMGLLAAGVAHEINNPLTYVLYNCTSLEGEIPKLSTMIGDCMDSVTEQLVDAGIPIDVQKRQQITESLDSVHSRLKDVVEGVGRIHNVTTTLSAFSRSDRETLVPVNLNHIIDMAAKTTRHETEYRANVIKDYQADLPDVTADEGRLFQVFLNLIINALHAIDDGGKETNELSLKSWTDGDTVYAQVKDTGSGIAPEHIPHLFDPFFTTKKIGEGSGLGLSISHSIIQDCGGSIEVESTPGLGTTFTIRLPVRVTDVRLHENPHPDAVHSSAQGRVLIVDDEPYLQSAMADILSDYETVEAGTGIEARKILEQDQGFDAIVCDLMMNDLPGNELHAWLSKVHSALAGRLVFITGGAFIPKVRKYIEEADVPILEKPFDVSKFRKVVGDTVRSAKEKESPTS